MPEDFDMSAAMIDELLEFLTDTNGAELEIPSTAKKWRQKESRLFKILFLKISKVDEINQKLDELTKTPPITMWVKNHILRSFAILAGIIGLFVGLWPILFSVYTGAATLDDGVGMSIASSVVLLLSIVYRG